MIIQVFFKFHDFSMHETFISDFPGFPWFPELVGNLSKSSLADSEVVTYKTYALTQLNKNNAYRAR